MPYRNRDEQLRVFLHHIHPVLMRQNIHYRSVQLLGQPTINCDIFLYSRIFVISQDDKELFNRAMNFNVGYSEAMKSGDFNCLVFHDVDLLPEDDRILYTCSDQPRHLSVAIDKFKYALPYKGELLGQMLGWDTRKSFSFLRNIRRRLSDDSSAVQTGQWVLQPVLGLGRRGRRHVQTYRQE